MNSRPEWLAVDRGGRRGAPGDPQLFICPANPEARAHVVEVCRDIAVRYDVDGIHLDYIRYGGDRFCYCAHCLSLFEEQVASRLDARRRDTLRARGRLGFVHAFHPAWGRFRREQITSLVAEIRRAVKAERPRALLTAAVVPWGPFHSRFTHTPAFDRVAQDWYGWIRAGLVDAVCPMIYHPDLAAFNAWVRGVTRANPRFPVWFGIGAYLCSSEGAAARVREVRRAGAAGWVLFSYSAVTRGGDDLYLRKLRARIRPRGARRGSPGRRGAA